ncbi:hypothetical protein DOTSEDRAFT_169965 [Dothistroma septosporum NZE10]|uniref:EthD domain-containing protein n=1 Tax=Dothistroma septosporum (strain NZE10 / CBS 128990) TaxID=675120 RepID=N1PR62_DOTSN|nr:hypothetical protein DOTSEDRAFT_169965 [Dothistroma septosporum NZE10]
MSTPIKQFVLVRRRAGQSVQAFFDHHYRIHGKLSDDALPAEKPLAYYQTHFFDSIYANTTLAQSSWSGHNDSTELYFDNEAAMLQVFGSEYVKNVIAPDGQNFNDFAAAIPIITREEVLFNHLDHASGPDEQILTATWWVQATMDDHSPLIRELNPLVAKAFRPVAFKVVANVALPDDTGILKYFTGESAPAYSAAYQVYLGDKSEIANFVQAQQELERAAGSLIVKETTFVVFGVRSVVLDQPNCIAFDVARQPRL